MLGKRLRLLFRNEVAGVANHDLRSVELHSELPSRPADGLVCGDTFWGTSVADTSHAVFLSYASQDSGAARRISDALGAAGIQVWFDQSELRAGDAWDQKIRRELRDCALFVPGQPCPLHPLKGLRYIRAGFGSCVHTYRYYEGAVARDHVAALIRQVPLEPEVTFVSRRRICGHDEAPAAFVERIQRLLSRETAARSDEAWAPGNASAAPPSRRPKRLRIGFIYGVIAAGARSACPCPGRLWRCA